jgi:hypothetical protein
MRFKFLQGTQVDHSRLRRSGRAFPSPRPPSPMVDLWQVYPMKAERQPNMANYEVTSNLPVVH